MVILLFLFSFGVFLANSHIANSENTPWSLFYGNTQIIIAIILVAIPEISGLFRIIDVIRISPALIFSTSFFVIIIIGSGMLMLPNAHTVPLSFLDSLFTSVSSVCVTGLTVVNTSTAFTTLGKIIILCLIQIGGLGIMTFTGLFSYIFTSSSSFRERFLLREIFSSQSFDNLFKILTKIILLTFLTETVGALIIYSSLNEVSTNKILFSIFHSVSAFCNAGFSTLQDGLYSASIRYNSGVQISVALLVVLGGIGFPVLLNLYLYFKHLFSVLPSMIKRRPFSVAFIQKNISDRIVLVMTIILILAGMGLYYLFENDNSIQGLNDSQKLMVSFFGSISARTAGFNIVDISQWSYATIFIMIFLMWIGASPGSTGGGIKTTTFAIAFRSALNSIRGRQHFVIGNREIGHNTISRVLSIIFLSILIITVGFFCLLISENEKNPVYLLFECVSAFSTVGLSIADTSSFTDSGKIVVMLLMFIGRVGPLTLLTGLLISSRKKYSRYPETEISIN
ncbi:MAG: ATPase [Bacteroidales bacterium]|nr:ATPase [Bacteroidales bacterium]